MKTLCPDEEMLADYLEGRLSDEERSQMEEHLSACKGCLEELVVTNSLLRGGDRAKLNSLPEEVTGAAVRLVKKQRSTSCNFYIERIKRSVRNVRSKMSDLFSLKARTGWQLEPIRGSKIRMAKNLIYLRKTFKDIDTEIEVEKTGENKAHIRVKLIADCGLRIADFLGPDSEKGNSHTFRLQGDNTPQKMVRVTLKKDEREICSYLANDAYVLFEDIPFGHYNLSFARDGVMLGRYYFEVKEAGHGGR
ncbi:MAG: zf-HC2 domain-containing protein [Desulfobacterales bacterium]|nr:zf-HC2 domain-containing protein [Desulfobacterales bacterium]